MEVEVQDKQERTTQVEILHSRVRVREGSEYNNIGGDRETGGGDSIRAKRALEIDELEKERTLQDKMERLHSGVRERERERGSEYNNMEADRDWWRRFSKR